MAIDVADLFEDDMDEKALERVASKFDAKDYDDLSNPNVMQTFYRRLFPYKQLFHWLNQDHGALTDIDQRDASDGRDR